MNDYLDREKEIERLRDELNILVTRVEGNLGHPEVMELSGKLDKLIVECQKQKAQSK